MTYQTRTQKCTQCSYVGTRREQICPRCGSFLSVRVPFNQLGISPNDRFVESYYS